MYNCNLEPGKHYHDLINLCHGRPDVIWASPDCTTYSVASISKHRRLEPDGNLKGVTEYAHFCDEVNAHVIELIKELIILDERGMIHD